MRKQILEISRKLEAHYIDAETTKSELLNLFNVSKRYTFTFKDVYTDQLIIIHEDTERKAFKLAFRTFETPKDRELKLVSKELNAY